jgi:hypothetical protein
VRVEAWFAMAAAFSTVPPFLIEIGRGCAHSHRASIQGRGLPRDLWPALLLANPSRGLGNGILPVETGGRIQAPNEGERLESSPQTRTFLANRRELRGFLSTWKTAIELRTTS